MPPLLAKKRPLQRPSPEAADRRPNVESPRPQMPESALYRFLSLYRYFTYMVGVLLVLVWPSLRGGLPSLSDYVVLGVVGAHVAFSVLVPLRPQPGSPISYASLVLDMGLAVGALLVTGGLDSGLLLYSLTPVLTASLLLPQVASITVAGASTFTLLGIHLTYRGPSWLLSGNYLSVFALYAIAAALVAVVPYRANLNLRRRLESTAVAQERRRFRRDLHDSLAQEVAALNLQAKQLRTTLSPSAGELAEEVTSLQAALQQTYSHVRSYLDILSLPSDLPLTSLLAEMANDFAIRTGVTLTTVLPQDHLGISPAAEAQLVAVAQEALRNIQKHAQARHVRLALASAPDKVELLVEDDGQGFDPEDVTTLGHYGLMGMRERAQEIGATLAVTSRPGRGTQVRLLLPR